MKARIGSSVIEVDEKRVRDGRVGCKETPGVQTPNVDCSSPYKSKLEASYAGYLHVLMLAGDIQIYRYEPVRIKLTDEISYVPDFYIRYKDGKEEWHEVKPHTKRILSREGRVKARIAATLYPSWRFVEVERVRGVWEQRELPA